MSIADLLTGRKEKEQDEEVRKAYNLLFTSSYGQKVLAHMLVELHFFDEITTEEEQVLSNYAKRLLYRIGVLQGFNINLFVDAILRAPISPPDTDE